MRKSPQTNTEKVSVFFKNKEKSGKFTKVISLFSSELEGERLNALTLATAILKQNGINWHELAAYMQGGKIQNQDGLRWGVKNYNARLNEIIDEIMVCSKRLTEFEELFLASIRSRTFLTPKQAAIFERIKTKTGIHMEI